MIHQGVHACRPQPQYGLNSAQAALVMGENMLRVAGQVWQLQ